MLQNNLLADILDSKQRYSLDDPGSKRRVQKKKLGQIPVMSSSAILSSSLMTYDTDLLYTISIPKVSIS
jgi:hypothetical protein